jgi:hypothetical protein
MSLKRQKREKRKKRRKGERGPTKAFFLYIEVNPKIK